MLLPLYICLVELCTSLNLVSVLKAQDIFPFTGYTGDQVWPRQTPTSRFIQVYFVTASVFALLVRNEC